eukprot:3972328-Pyramimonas_sp.AAC.1
MGDALEHARAREAELQATISTLAADNAALEAQTTEALARMEAAEAKAEAALARTALAVANEDEHASQLAEALATVPYVSKIPCQSPPESLSPPPAPQAAESTAKTTFDINPTVDSRQQYTIQRTVFRTFPRILGVCIPYPQSTVWLPDCRLRGRLLGVFA